MARRSLGRGLVLATVASGAVVVGGVAGSLMLTSASGSTRVAPSTAGESTNMAPITYAPVGPGADLPTYDSVAAAVSGVSTSPEFVGTDIHSVALTTPPIGSGIPNGNWLDIVVSGSNDGLGATLGDWEAAMLFAQLRDVLHHSSLPSVEGYTLDLQLGDGTVETLGGLGAGNVAFDQTFVSGSQAAMTAALTQEAVAAGLQIDSITFLHATDTIPIIDVTTADPQAFLDQHPDPSMVFSNSGPFDGIYVELSGPTGTPVLVSDGALRDGQGDIAVAPGYHTAAVSGTQAGS